MGDQAHPSFRMFGIPVTVEPGSLLVLVLLGAASGLPYRGIVAFVAGGFAALVVHELGHAVAARRFDAHHVSIRLTSFGGLTSYVLPERTRTGELVIAGAGPAAGLALGGVVYLVAREAAPWPWSPAAPVFAALLFVTVGWSLFNLVPVLPLDGGHVLAQFLPGSPEHRHRVATRVSAAVAAVAAVAAWRSGYTFAAVVFAVLGAGNVVGGAPEGTPEAATHGTPDGGRGHRHGPSCEVFHLVVADDLESARGALRALRRPDPAVAALVRWLSTADPDAERRLALTLAERPDDALVCSCVLVRHASRHDWPRVLAMVAGANLLLAAVPFAMQRAYEAGAYEQAVRIAEVSAPKVTQPGIAALLAYNAACCRALAGDPHGAFALLQQAVETGGTPPGDPDADPDLASVRDLPGYAEWRARQQFGGDERRTGQPER